MVVTVTEAANETSLSHEHITYLARNGKISARKAAGVWLIELESLKEYLQKMKELGTQKHTPKKSN
jgi:excisionase family DNA binding protein